jgi:hypothetical protein
MTDMLKLAEKAGELLLWLDTDRGTEQGLRRRADGDNTLIALTLYDAGGGTVESLTGDWALTSDQAKLLLAAVRLGWSQGRWADRRSADRRTA